MHWTTPGGACFKSRGDARAHAAAELERTDPRGAHPVLIDAAVLLCPIDWRHRIQPASWLALMMSRAS